MANTSCTSTISVTSNGIFQKDIPVKFEVPLLILQICIVLVVKRALCMLLKPLRQPHVIAEIIGGILLGPSGLGKIQIFKNTVFSQQSLTVLETFADLGLIFFLFLIGLELDLKAIRRTGRQAMAIAAAGITVPFIAGVGVSVVLRNSLDKASHFAPFMVFMGAAMSVTAFAVLARILAERRLLTTDVGQIAMSAAAVNDVVAWIFLALAVAFSGSNTTPLVALWVLLCGVAFAVLMFAVVKPIMTMVAHQAIQNEPINQIYVAITLAGVLVSGFMTDFIGIHSIFGAFVFGLIIPKDGPFAGYLIEKIEDFVTILMLPLYFVLSGLKTDIGSLHGAQSAGLLVLVIATACFGKVFGTFAVAALNGMDFRKSLTLGFLMNTKGLVELIVLNIGKDRKVLNDETFAIMVIMALFTTFITTPVVMAIYKPARNPVPYKRRTLYSPNAELDQDSELRILACVHGLPNVHAIINLIEAARGTARRRSLHMYILHLLEYSERTSSIMKVQRVTGNGLPFWDKKGQEYRDSDNVVVAFEAYGRLSKVTVRPMTAISSFEDMHEDVCVTAAEKRAAIIILPFHKHARPNYISGGGGDWEGQSSGLRHVTQKVLLHAPCSVGILVDRGIGMTSLSSTYVDQSVAVFFFGGPDDREALAFGYRMAEHPGVRLTVYRFMFGIEQQQKHQADGEQESISDTAFHSNRFPNNYRFSSCHDYMTADMDWAKESKIDEECLARVMKQKQVNISGTASPSDGSPVESNVIRYEEKHIVVDPGEAAVAIARSEGKRLSVVLLGRGRKPSSLIAPLFGKQAEYPELGPVGEALTTAMDVRCSVFVVQQYDSALAQELAPDASNKPGVLTPKSSGLNLSPSMVVFSSPAASPGPNYNNVGANNTGSSLAPSPTPLIPRAPPV